MTPRKGDIWRFDDGEPWRLLTVLVVVDPVLEFGRRYYTTRVMFLDGRDAGVVQDWSFSRLNSKGYWTRLA